MNESTFASNGVLCNCLSNGQFAGLAGWDVVDAAFDPTKGSGSMGSVAIAAGGMVSQLFAIPDARSWTVDLDVYGDAGDSVGVCVLDADGNVFWSDTVVIAADATWQHFTVDLGMPAGAYTLQVKAIAGDVCVDGASVAFVPITLGELVAKVASSLGAFLPAEIGCPAEGDALGVWSEAVLGCLREFGACLPGGEPDVRCIDPNEISAICACIEYKMACTVIASYWAMQTDFTLGPRSESKSQVYKALCKKYGIGNTAAQSSGRKWGQVCLARPERCGCAGICFCEPG